MNEKALRLAALIAAQISALLLLVPGEELAIPSPPEIVMESAGMEEDSVLPGEMEKETFPQVIQDIGLLPAAHRIEDFPLILQLPELPTGCEITAMTMVLRFWGYEVSKTTMAGEYLPIAEPVFHRGSGGLLYGPDMNNCFVGDPFSEWGYICGAGAVRSAAENYLQVHGGAHTAIELTGALPGELYGWVAMDIPVVVWLTIELREREDVQGWYTESGEYVEWSSEDHSAVLIGFTEETVTIADPLAGIAEYDRERFEAVFEARGRQCVMLAEAEKAAAQNASF